MSTEKPDSSPASLFRTGYQPERHANRRRTGSRAKLAKRFFEDIYAAWEEQGESALARAAFHDPMGFVSMVARLMPQKIEVSTPTDGMSDERLAEMLDMAERMAALRSSGAMALPVLEHRPVDENAIGAGALIEGGGGPDRSPVLGGVNTSSPLRADPGRIAETPYNKLDDATAPDSQNATPPYPVGRPFPKPDHVVERENRRALGNQGTEDGGVDPESLF